MKSNYLNHTITAISAFAILAASLFAYQPAQAASSGDLVKLADQSSVYYVSDEGKRHAFPNDKVFFSWYEGFSDVKTISPEEMGNLSLGKNIVYRPGTRFVKIQSIPKTYVVTPSGVLRWIQTEQIAEGLAGSNWNQNIDDIPDSLFGSYEIGDPLTTANLGFDGMLIDKGGEIYLLDNGQKRRINVSGVVNNRYQPFDYALPAPGVNLNNIPDGSDIIENESRLRDTSQMDEVVFIDEPVNNPIVPDIYLTESIPPSMTLSGNLEDIHVASFRINASLEPMMVNKITLENCLVYAGANCTQDGADDVISSVSVSYVNANGSIESKTGFFSNGEVTFSGIDMYIPRNQNRVIVVSVDTANIAANAADSGSQFRVNLTTANTADFEAVGLDSGTTYSGASSVVQVCGATSSVCNGNTMTVRKSGPGLSLSNDSPVGPGIPGNDEVFIFNVSAGAGGSITMNQFLFKLNASDSANTDWNFCGDGGGNARLADTSKWRFYDIDDSSTDLDDNEDWTFLNSSGTDCGTNAEDLVYAQLDLDSVLGSTAAEEIGAGGQKTFVLRLDTFGASTSPDDIIRVEIPTEGEANGIGRDAIHWEDGSEDTTDIDGSLIDGLPLRGGVIIY